MWDRDTKERMAVEGILQRENLSVEGPLAKVSPETFRGFSRALIPSLTRCLFLCRVPLALDVAV